MSTTQVPADGEQMEETIDQRQRPRKKVVLSRGQTTTMTYNHWGVKVLIKAPPTTPIATDPSVLKS